MYDDAMVTASVVIAELLGHAGRREHALARVGDAAVLTVAVVAAASFQHHHARALPVLQGGGYLPRRPSVSRFNRRLHALADWLALLAETLGALVAHGEAFVLDGLPLPVCRRARARRCRKLRGQASCGDCAAEREQVFGWRLHLVCPPAGVPVAFARLPAAWHALTPVHELTVGLPRGAAVYADKAYHGARDEASILAETGVRLGPRRRADMRPNDWVDKLALREHRQRIETANSQLEAMGVPRRRARTTAGFDLKVHAALVALVCLNAF